MPGITNSNTFATATRPKSHNFAIGLLVACLISMLVGLWKFQDIHDFIRLFGYKPGVKVAAISAQDGFTDYSQKLFYINRPQLMSPELFSGACPNGSEKTVVLGCYKGNDRGIFLFDVTDSRLSGVVEVTAAHEMLHAAYDRMSGTERLKVDGLLSQYYKEGLKDERIKKTIQAYQETEPSELVNEMHSIFATEIYDLPESLELYYKKYFSNRKQVVTLLNNYQMEFTKRQDRIDSYDAQLKSLKQSINENETSLESLSQQIAQQQKVIANLRSSGHIEEYNSQVNPFNALVKRYNDLLNSTRQQIDTYNATVAARNSIASEQRELVQSMSAKHLPENK